MAIEKSFTVSLPSDLADAVQRVAAEKPEEFASRGSGSPRLALVGDFSESRTVKRNTCSGFAVGGLNSDQVSGVRSVWSK